MTLYMPQLDIRTVASRQLVSAPTVFGGLGGRGPLPLVQDALAAVDQVETEEDQEQLLWYLNLWGLNQDADGV